MAFADRLSFARRQKKIRQADLGKLIGASGDIIGKYERNDNLPSIEMALKLANIFDVSVDYLLGEGQHASYDKETIKRLQEIENLDSETKKTIFQVIDTFLRDSKARMAYS